MQFTKESFICLWFPWSKSQPWWRGLGATGTEAGAGGLTIAGKKQEEQWKVERRCEPSDTSPGDVLSAS